MPGQSSALIKTAYLATETKALGIKKTPPKGRRRLKMTGSYALSHDTINQGQVPIT
jgi:hypothetical protein